MLSKKSQTAWRKPKTEKRMSRDDLQQYRAWLFLTHPICQICNVNPAIAHAVKKMLMPGHRGHKDRATDIEEAIVALHRAKELEGL